MGYKLLLSSASTPSNTKLTYPESVGIGSILLNRLLSTLDDGFLTEPSRLLDGDLALNDSVLDAQSAEHLDKVVELVG